MTYVCFMDPKVWWLLEVLAIGMTVSGGLLFMSGAMTPTRDSDLWAVAKMALSVPVVLIGVTAAVDLVYTERLMMADTAALQAYRVVRPMAIPEGVDFQESLAKAQAKEAKSAQH